MLVLLFQVILNDDQDIESGEKIAQDLMSKLDIKSEDLIANAYIDLLSKSIEQLYSIEIYVLCISKIIFYIL